MKPVMYFLDGTRNMKNFKISRGKTCLLKLLAGLHKITIIVMKFFS
jgi:hypothetical protein